MLGGGRADLAGLARRCWLVEVARLRFLVVLFVEWDLDEDDIFANGSFEERPRECGVRFVSSHPCPFADEIVPAQRHEKGIKQRTDGITIYAAPMKLCCSGTNCMIRKKTGDVSGWAEDN